MRGNRCLAGCRYYQYSEHDDSIHETPTHSGIGTADDNSSTTTVQVSVCPVPPGAISKLWELYDLRNDPTEVVNVADDP